MHVVELKTAGVSPESHDGALLKRVLEIHDEMPLDWDTNHRGSQAHLDQMFQDITAHADAHRFWVLSDENIPRPDTIRAFLWAVIKKKPPLDREVCSVNSLWIEPRYRGLRWTAALAERCKHWVSNRGVSEIECSTYFTNRRMRDILEKLGFQPTYLSYSLSVLK